MSDPAIGYVFHVAVDNMPLGVFTKVEGLAAKYETVTIKEGGQNSYVHTLFGRRVNEPLSLTRPVDRDSGRIAAWFSEYESVLQSGGRLRLATATIAAFGPDDDVLARWDLDGVHPMSYTGPSFQAGSATVLTEKLQLAYRAFTFNGDSGAPPGSGARPSAAGLSDVGPAIGAGASF